MLKYVVEFEMQNCHAYSLETILGTFISRKSGSKNHCVFQIPDSCHMTEGKTRFRAFCHVFWTFQVKFVRTHCEQWNKLGGGMVQMIR